MDTPKPKPDQRVVIENDKSVKWDAWEAQHKPLDPNAKIVDTRHPDNVPFQIYMDSLSSISPQSPFRGIDIMAVAARASRISMSSPYRLDSIYRTTPEQGEVIVKPDKGE